MFQIGQPVAVRINETTTGEGTVLSIAKNDSGVLYNVQFPDIPARWWTAKQVFEIIAPADQMVGS